MAGILVSTAAGGLTEVTGVGIGSNAPRVSVSGPLAAVSASLILPIDVSATSGGMSTCMLQLTGTWVGIALVLTSIDGGVTYLPENVTPTGSGGGPSVSSISANGRWELSAAGLTHVQIVMSAYTSGSAAAYIAAANGGKIARVKAPSSDPLPTLDSNNAPFSVVTPLTVGGAAIAPGRSLAINASVAGNVTFITSSGNIVTRPVSVGYTEFAYAVTQVTNATTATATYENLS